MKEKIQVNLFIAFLLEGKVNRYVVYYGNTAIGHCLKQNGTEKAVLVWNQKESIVLTINELLDLNSLISLCEIELLK